MATSLGLSERAALVLLAVNGGTLIASELRTRHGVVLKRAPRERLVERKLIAEAEAGQSFRLSLTDQGWRFLDEEIAADPPRGSRSDGKALFALLPALSAVRSLRDLLAGTDPLPEPLEKRIGHIYRALAKGPRDWVELKALRSALANVDRDTLDATLKKMRRDKAITMTLEDDQSRLTKDDRAAALKIGPDDMHYVSMD